MPGRTKLSKAEQARRFLIHGGVAREDSDDELGLEDLPWIWIYKTQKGYESEEDEASEDEVSDDGPSKGRKRKRKTRTKRKEDEIIGAKMGNFGTVPPWIVLFVPACFFSVDILYINSCFGL